DALRAGCPHPLCHEIERFIPTCAAPNVRTAIIANLRIHQALRISENLAGAAAAYAQEAPTVRILAIAANRLEGVAFDLCQHSAICRMKLHGTHGADNPGSRGSHGPVSSAPSPAIVPEMYAVATAPTRSP